jgi:hypothetical protein
VLAVFFACVAWGATVGTDYAYMRDGLLTSASSIKDLALHNLEDLIKLVRGVWGTAMSVDLRFSIPVGLFFLLVMNMYVCVSGRRQPSRPAVAHERKTPRGTGDVIECVNPANGEKLGECRAYTKAETKAAIAAGRAAQQEWSKTDMAERSALLMDILDWIVDNQQMIIEMSVQESGKTLTEASLGEVMATCEKIRWVAKYG